MKSLLRTKGGLLQAITNLKILANVNGQVTKNKAPSVL